MPLKYVYGQDHLIADFVARMTPHVSVRPNSKAIGVLNNDNELIAGLVYNYALPGAGVMEITIAALPGHLWLTRETVRIMFEYPFLQCGCQMLITFIRASDRRALRQVAAINCALILFPRLYGRDDDGVIARLTKEDWEASKFCYRRDRAEIGASAMAA
jgi:hypothetical protein